MSRLNVKIINLCIFLWCCEGSTLLAGTREKGGSKSLRAAQQNHSVFDTLSRKDVKGIAKIAEKLTQLFPHTEYTYLFLGRSPTPILAFFEAHAHYFPSLRTFALPLSQAGLLDYFLEYKGYLHNPDEPRVDYAQKLFDHFDLYLEEALQELIQKAPQHRKIVLVDFAMGGDSIGQAKRSIDFYLRYKAHQDEDLKSYLSIKTAYAAIIATSDSTSLVKKSIDACKRPFQPKVSGEHLMYQVQPLSPDKGNLVPVDMNRRSAMINTLTDQQHWYWQGSVIAMSDLKIPKTLTHHFHLQRFDRVSPYGPWFLDEGMLLKEKPRRAPSYERFKQQLNQCSL